MLGIQLAELVQDNSRDPPGKRQDRLTDATEMELQAVVMDGHTEPLVDQLRGHDFGMRREAGSHRVQSAGMRACPEFTGFRTNRTATEAVGVGCNG